MGEQLKITGDPGNIREHLEFYKPDANRKELSLSFDRSREVPISWRAIIRSSAAQQAPYEPSPNAVEPFRSFFAQHWGIADPDEPTTAELDKVARDFVTFESAQIWRVTTTSRTETGGKAQVYQLVARQDAAFDKSDFDTQDKYKAVWEKVDRVQVPADQKTEMEDMDLSPGVIWRQYKELADLRKLGEMVSTQADDLAKAAAKSDFLDPDQLRTLVAQYLGMKSLKSVVEEKLLRLQDQAEDLGYVLNVGTTDITFKFPDNTSQVIKPGELYQPYKKVVTWQTVHSRRELHISWGWFGPRIRFRNVTYTLTHSESVTSYKQMVIDFDPWVEKERKLTEAGFKSYRFERYGGDYRTPSGVSLEEVLVLCDRDKQFWGKCVVWIPVYDQKLTEGEVLVKYLIITRPVRGVEVVHLPRIFIEENLSIRRSSDVRVELGELAHTINLAPGEKRTITIDRAVTTEREDRRTAKSLVDLVDTESTDFSTELEKETRKETEKSNSSNWSVKASGSWGPASASASGGGTSSMKTKDFARQLEKVAQKAARSVTKKTQEEITTSTSAKTTMTSSDRNVIDIQNVNAGRSLNLAFYRLNNVSKVGLYLDGIEFVVLPGVEAVAGSGIILPEVYSLSELPDALNRLSLSAMPLRAIGDPKQARRAYGKQLLLDLVASLEDDYVGTDDNALLIVEADGDDDTIEAIKQAIRDYDPGGDGNPEGSKLLGLVNRLLAFLQTARVSKKAIGGEKDLVSGSAGFYLDTYVGVREATEPYAEQARELELRSKVAETAELLARAAYYRSLPQPGGGALVPRVLDDKTLELTYTASWPKGTWGLYADGAHVADLKVSSSNKTHKWSFPDPQAWLTGNEKNVVHVVHESGTTLACVV